MINQIMIELNEDGTISDIISDSEEIIIYVTRPVNDKYRKETFVPRIEESNLFWRDK